MFTLVLTLLDSDTFRIKADVSWSIEAPGVWLVLSPGLSGTLIARQLLALQPGFGRTRLVSVFGELLCAATWFCGREQVLATLFLHFLKTTRVSLLLKRFLMLKTWLKAWLELLIPFLYLFLAWKLSLLSANPVTSSDSPSHGGEPLAGP